MDSCDELINIVQNLSINVEDYSNFVERICESLYIKNPKHKNQLFILNLIKEIVNFSILKGNPHVTNEKDTHVFLNHSSKHFTIIFI